MKMIFAALFMMIALSAPAFAVGRPHRHAPAPHPVHQRPAHHAGHHKR